MQQLVDNTSVNNDIADLIKKSSAILSQSLDRLENALQGYCNKKGQLTTNLIGELDEYISQLKTVIDGEQASNANS